MLEEWKQINDYYANYLISNQGRVMNVNTCRILAPTTTKNNYMLIGLCQHGVQKMFYVHRLVATAFIPNPENKPCVNHIDNNPSNNNKSNLEWCTHSENTQHSVKQGRMVIGNNKKLTQLQVDEIRKSDSSSSDLAVMYNVTYNTIYSVRNFINWKV